MTRIVLTADHTLMTEFRNNSLFSFLSSMPTRFIPELLYDRIFAPMVPHNNGIAKYAQYSLRKVEATLLQEFNRSEVVIAHPKYIDKFIGSDTEILGINTMDPLGLGPIPASFHIFSDSIPHTQKKFEQMVKKLPRAEHKIVLGGGGSMQFVNSERRERYSIDHVILGEFEKSGIEIFTKIMNGTADSVMRGRPPQADEIPPIKGPSINSLIEIARGCGRRCHFCDPTLRRIRNIPHEQIIAEAEINAASGKRSTWILSEDIFLYRCDSQNFQPNREALIELYQALMAIEGVDNILATHGSLAPVAADPKLVEELTAIVGRKYKGMQGLQPGIETGSIRLIEKNMPNKTLPFAPDEWHDVVVDAIRILNKNNWFPWCTLILGLPGEEKEDIEETIALVDELSGTYCTITPTFFVPMGSTKNANRFGMEDLTEKYWELIYKCWKHSSQAENQGCYLRAPQINNITKLALMLTMKIGSRAVLRRINRTQQHLMSRTLQT